MSDPAVRKALNMAIDRDVIVETGYGVTGKPTCNIIPGPDIYVSTTNDWCLKPDVAGANKLLDDAGWKMGPDGVRAKNGVKLSFVFQTSTNSVRQATQALLKDMWRQIGVAVELRNISASVFFGGDPRAPTRSRSSTPICRCTRTSSTARTRKLISQSWLCDKIPNPKNGWQGENYVSLLRRRLRQDDRRRCRRRRRPPERAELVKALNDKLVTDGVVIPLVFRGLTSAYSNRLAGVRQNGLG